MFSATVAEKFKQFSLLLTKQFSLESTYVSCTWRFCRCIDLSPQNRKIAPGSFLKNVFFSSTGVTSALDIGHPMHPRCILVPLHRCTRKNGFCIRKIFKSLYLDGDDGVGLTPHQVPVFLD